MVKLIFHGDDHLKSRQLFQQELDKAKKSGVKDIIRFDAKTITETDFIQALQSQSLFGTARQIACEGVFSIKSKSLKELVLAELARDEVNHILLWESKALTPAQLKKLPGFKPILSKINPIIFKYLDSLTPEPSPTMLKLYDEAVSLDSAEFVFHMTLRHLRELILVADGGTVSPAWKQKKLAAQAQKYGVDRLVSLHDRLYFLDYHRKSGRTLLPLERELNLALFNINN